MSYPVPVTGLVLIIRAICYDPSSEPSHRDGSDEESQYMFYADKTIIISKYHQNTPSYLELWQNSGYVAEFLL